jgi:predicted dienelactone hydrolase
MSNHSGLRLLDVVDDALGLSFPAVVQYPTAEPPQGVTLGPYHFRATMHAPVAAGPHKLAVVSHGGGGSHLLYRSISTHLAEQGWVVVCLEHPQDNRNDRSLVNTDIAAERRARHASLALDVLLADTALGAHIDATRVAVIGHSMGGVTALSLIGAQPWSASRVPLAVHADPRVRAAVLLAPAWQWFMAPGALNNVRAPILAYVAEHDVVTPPASVRRMLGTLPADTPCEVRDVPNGGHFSFLTSFPPALCRADFPPSQDPPGFDRAALHDRLPGEIATWLASAL